jgi:hypothetical protein
LIFFVILLLNKALGERVGGSSFFHRKGFGPPLSFEPVRPMTLATFLDETLC